MNKFFVIIAIGFFLGGCGEARVANNPVPTAGASYSLADVTNHGKQGDCWFVISGKVYDISLFSEHPGGNIILEACGKEATEMFNTKGGKGKMHSDVAMALLSKFYKGDLK